MGNHPFLPNTETGILDYLIKEADKITDEILQSVSEKLYHELYPIYVKARDYRQERDKLSNIEMRRKLEEGS